VDGQEEDQYYLRNDLSISCSSERYNTGVAIAAFMILLYPFGIPALYWWQLFRHRDLIRYRSIDGKSGSIAAIAKRYGFLYKSYEPRFWYWESVEAIRRIVLTGVVSVLSPSSSTQSVAGMILALVYIGLYGQLKPYEDDKDDTLAFVGQYQIFWTFFGTLVIGNDLLGSNQAYAVSVFIITGNLTVLFLGFAFELADYRRELGLRTFEDRLGQYLSYIPFNTALKKRKERKKTLSTSLDVSSLALDQVKNQPSEERLSKSLERISLAQTQVENEQKYRKSGARLSESLEGGSLAQAQVEDEEKYCTFEGNTSSKSLSTSALAQDAGEMEANRFKYVKAIFAEPQRINSKHYVEKLMRLGQEGLDDERSKSYLKYAFLKKEALRIECEATAQNLEGHLYRVKERLREVSEDASVAKISVIEMTENPM
jgi:hypothetical protein